MKCKSLDDITTVFEHNVLRLQEAKEAGQKVVGQFCLYSPSEIALAAGAIPVSLCGTKNDSIATAETELPRSLCPLIKSSYGFALQKSCPYLSASDVVVADTTCDGKKKMYEFLAEKVSLILLQLPQVQDSPALAQWREELKKLIYQLEQQFSCCITEEDLHRAIVLMNKERSALKKVMDLAKRIPSPITGMELVEIGFKTSYFPNKEDAISMLEAVAKEMVELADTGITCYAEDTVRILLTGVPVGMGSHKVVRLIEECGANVVCLDNCSGYKKTRIMVEEEGDALDAIAKAYLEVPCAVMSPNPHRYATLRTLSEEFSVDAIIDLTWHGCQTYAVESGRIKPFVQQELNKPFLHLETDYSETDTEQLKVRIEAFIEMVTHRKK